GVELLSVPARSSVAKSQSEINCFLFRNPKYRLKAAKTWTLMSFSEFQHFGRLRSAVCLLGCLVIAAGCATHKKPPAPPPTYPPVPETAVQELHQLPAGLYDRLQIITAESEVGERFASALRSARESAAQKGAN